MSQETDKILTPDICGLTITIVYDNHSYKQGLETGWGFSCLISGVEKTILFDTGPGGSLIVNMEKLAIEPQSIDTVVLSHIHPDHTGGLEGFLEKNPDVTVYLPKSFPERFKDWSAGQTGKWIKEQSLVIKTDKGLVVISGCSHPGIVNIVSAAKDLVKDDILLVMGGFHLECAGKGKIEKVISVFKHLGVRYVGLCHGSGDKARALFEEYFGGKYIKLGAGKVITIANLE
ncbi:MAG: MBL fold metallo-hydrolase [Planctomycetota bacterium]|jgi:7,8-dihydropterin-6-yl-methyl-4-(beta-D-ribofuranosyl)aminobenzene 5'-phosphate synthase